ncbi:MAG: T9SS type A sorting domain-containing protein [Ferruginibacter sp.]|nr:T9SS type A sorting domain-containing protein [Ferruginibacter sp.]
MSSTFIRKFSVILLLNFLVSAAFAQGFGDIFQSYLIVNRGTGNEFFDLKASTSNPDFSGSLGTFNLSQTLKLNGAQNKTFKCNSLDITGGSLLYRVYPSSQTPGSFIGVSLGFSSNDAGAGSGCQNQTWQASGVDIDLLNGLCDGEYVIEVYTTANYTDIGGSGTFFANDGGANYKATFTVKNDDQAGIFESYAILNIDNTGNTYYNLQAPGTSTNADFDGLDLGDFCSGKTLTLSGAQNKTYRCGFNDILNGLLYYRIYPSGTTPTGSFTKVDLGFSTENPSPVNPSCLDQVWEKADASIDLLSGLSAGEYILEIYTQADYNYGPCSSVYYINKSGVNYKAKFSVCIASLPVSFSIFTGTRRGSNVDLSWATEAEKNTIRFEVERKTGGHFEKIGSVSTLGNTVGRTYVFTDINNQYNGVSQYRIKSVGKNNELKYSKIILVNNRQSGLQIMNIIPSLVEKSPINIHISSDRPLKIEVQIADISGKQIQRTAHQIIAGSNPTQIDVSRLLPGTYFVTAYSSEGKSGVYRFVKR